MARQKEVEPGKALIRQQPCTEYQQADFNSQIIEEHALSRALLRSRSALLWKALFLTYNLRLTVPSNSLKKVCHKFIPRVRSDMS
ncbi:predicted protein [Sclerotinia sclerotiorum 1980 UF-70]|uniref:Uncharacterized protein n=1 Tax=Sclerotinia sclerotiorum (strain ATCC 18683 / 1980 / Ss-1) TaxID=665079 RepID=A7ETK0_SCLS1|nr:predicted protein [Sclerotinia sclerotiorum 1980 UF-70]EDN92792.1 predicted protein [Sclerotinia sclerotiorum 1980 UF-70]